jgi:hypothetical protein
MCIANSKTWYPERLIRLVAGIFVLGSVLLGLSVHLFHGFRGPHADDFCLDRLLSRE